MLITSVLHLVVSVGTLIGIITLLVSNSKKDKVETGRWGTLKDLLQKEVND